MGFEGNGVFDRVVRSRQSKTLNYLPRCLCPAVTVVKRQDRTSPVKFVLGGHIAFEINPEGNLVATYQAADFSRRHVIAQPGNTTALFAG